MTSVHEAQVRERRRTGALLGVVLAVGLCAAALGLFVHQARTGLAGRLASYITGRPLVTISAPDVVEKIQRLNRLETVVFSLDTVVESHESSPVLPDALAGDRLLMIVHGQTIAGIDFSKLQPGSVHITEAREGRSIRLALPPSEVFVTTIDTRKHECTRGIRGCLWRQIQTWRAPRGPGSRASCRLRC